MGGLRSHDEVFLHVADIAGLSVSTIIHGRTQKRLVMDSDHIITFMIVIFVSWVWLALLWPLRDKTEVPSRDLKQDLPLPKGSCRYTVLTSSGLSMYCIQQILTWTRWV